MFPYLSKHNIQLEHIQSLNMIVSVFIKGRLSVQPDDTLVSLTPKFLKAITYVVQPPNCQFFKIKINLKMSMTS